jgi:hypothetical protein
MGRSSDVVAELEALVAGAGDAVVRRRGISGEWTFCCAEGHEWTRRAADELDTRRRGLGCRRCRTAGVAAPMVAHVAAMGGEVLSRGRGRGGPWTVKCGAGHEWMCYPKDELSARRWCRQCRIDAEAEAARGEGEAAALRAVLLAEEAWKYGRLAPEAGRLERARRKAFGACLACGRPTRHIGRTKCDVCRIADPEKSALKARTMDAYGGRCSSCGCSVLAFLCIDHIDRARPPGAPRTGAPLWAWLEARGWPGDCFRCLCGNCNHALESYGYLPSGRRLPEWDHGMLLGRIDPSRVAGRTRELCVRLEALRASEGLSITKFARTHGLAGTATSVARTASGWVPPPGATRGTVMPRATPFTARVLRRVEAALGMAGRLCKSCGEELPLAEFGAARAADAPDHCGMCRRARKLRDRLAAIGKYGGACACCGEETYEFLAIDHAGGVRPRGMSARGGDLYHRLAAGPRRGDYRILCHNCNFSYLVHGQRCPHEWIDPAMTLTEQAAVNLRTAVASAQAKAEARLELDCLGDMVEGGSTPPPSALRPEFVVRHERGRDGGVCLAFSCPGNRMVGRLEYGAPPDGLVVRGFRVDERCRGRDVGAALATRLREENPYVSPEAVSWAPAGAGVRAFLDAVFGRCP